jgi:hypothetical protein
MEKQGATLDQSLAAMKAIASDRASATHPGKSDRLAAITRGWNAGRTSSISSNTNSTTQPTTTPTHTNPGYPQTQTNPTPTQPTAPVNTGANTDPNTDPSWIGLSMQSVRDETVYLSDDGKSFQPATIPAGQIFFLKFEIYQYGWLRMKYYNGYRVYKLYHGKDYNILWNRRTKNWSVIEIPE